MNIRRTTVDWDFTPKDLLEESYSSSTGNYKLQIGNGLVAAWVAIPADPLPANLLLEMRSHAIRVLSAASVLAGRPFELGLHKVTQEYPNASRSVQLATGFDAHLVREHADVVERDPLTGKVLRDTAAERRLRHAAFIALMDQAALKNPLVASLIASVSMSLNDPKNAFVHLYEVRDALSSHFGGEGMARQALGISKKDWQFIGRLANDEPLEEGRHRGKAQALRPATEAELESSRNMALAWIETFAKSL